MTNEGLVLWIRANWNRCNKPGLLLLLLLFNVTTDGEVRVVSPSTPTMAPRLASIVPPGGQLGSRVTVTIEGSNLLNTEKIEFEDLEISAKILSKTAQTVTAEILIGLGVAVGQHDFRLSTTNGSTVAIFQIGAIDEIVEQEPNGELGTAELLTLPTVVNGILGVSKSGDRAGDKADFDFFSFNAEAGQTLVFDVISTRIGAKADTYITLFDVKGRKLVENADYYQDKDAFLAHEFGVSGRYAIRVATFGGGSRTAAYRLFVGELPYVFYSFPSGGRSGKTTTFTLSGLNLSKVKKVVLGGGLATGKVVESGAKQATFRMHIPLGLEPRDYWLYAINEDGTHNTWPVLFNVDTILENTVRNGTARGAENAVYLSAPVVVNGLIDEPRAADHFWIEAAAGERFTFQVQSMLLGSLLDPVVVIYDSAGSRIALQDDPGSTDMWKARVDLDPHLSHKFEKAGRYRVVVRDIAQRGNSNWTYRLKIRSDKPDYELLVLTPHQTILRGRTTKENGPDRFDPVHLLVQVRRRGGWNTPVEVWADDLPTGVTADRIVVPAENTYYRGTDAEDKWLDGTRIELPIIASPDAPIISQPIRVRSRGAMEDRTLERSGKVLYEYNPTGFMARRRTNAFPDDGQIYLTVADPPQVTFEAPGAVTVKEGKVEEIKLSLNWWGELEMPITLRAVGVPPGLQVTQAQVSHGEESATMSMEVTRAVENRTARAVIVAETVNEQGSTVLYSKDILIAMTGEKSSQKAYKP